MGDMNYIEQDEFDREQEAEDSLENYHRALDAEERRQEYGPSLATATRVRSTAEWRRLAEASTAASRARRTPPQGDRRIEALMFAVLVLTVLVALYLTAHWQAGVTAP